MTVVNVEVIGYWGNRLTARIDIQCTDAANYRGIIEYSHAVSESSQHELSDKQIKRLTKALDSLWIPAVPEFVMGLDGHRVNLSIEQGFNSASYSWWVEPPAGWEKLGSLVKTVLGLAPMKEALARVLRGPFLSRCSWFARTQRSQAPELSVVTLYYKWLRYKLYTCYQANE